MPKKSKYDSKHLTLSQRVIIEKGLVANESFTAIARKIRKDPSTVSKEVKRHKVDHVRIEFGRDIPCAKRDGCMIHRLCDDESCRKSCKMYPKPKFYCTKIYKDYIPRKCERLEKSPYVCNGCIKNPTVFKNIFVFS